MSGTNMHFADFTLDRNENVPKTSAENYQIQ